MALMPEETLAKRVGGHKRAERKNARVRNFYRHYLSWLPAGRDSDEA
jgi:hypothetical protein